ncbi:hypothetical protein GN958_ATG09132 [Phytophthora infestans]|nr:hypothetical protein GN958_ATG09132 [Phytophthora infestans]
MTATGKFLKLGEKRKKKHQGTQKRYLQQPEDTLIFLDINLQYLRDHIEKLEQRYQHLRALVQPSQAANDQTTRLYAGYDGPSVVLNAEYGPEAILQHWFFVGYFDDVDVELNRWETTDGKSLVATTTTSVTISKHTLRSVFPHLRTTDNSDRNGKLAEKLLNQRLVMRGSTCFEWDASTGRVAKVISQSDMLTPMLKLLNDNMVDVSRVFEQALISSEFQWKPMLYYNAYPLRSSSSPVSTHY